MAARKRTLTLPDLAGDPMRRVAISMSHDEFAKLGGPNKDMLVAAGIMQDSLRTRLLKAIAERGPFAGPKELMADVRQGPRDQAFGLHEVVHILYSLNKAGSITFKRRGQAHADEVCDIAITSRGYAAAGIPVPGKSQEAKGGGRAAGTSRAGHAVGTDMTEQRNHRTVAEGGDILRLSSGDRQAAAAMTIPEDSLVAPVERVKRSYVRRKPYVNPRARTNEEAAPSRDWPELQQLREKLAAHDEAEARAATLTEAAALLEHVAPDEAERLLAMAVGQSAAVELSPVEREYLAFAEANKE